MTPERVHRPEGAGPFPALIWNHGSERHPAPRDDLARFYTAAGYVFFAPRRRRSDAVPPPDSIEGVIELLESELEDTLAAIDWLGRQPYVDGERMAVSGGSHGAIQTLLAAEAGARAKAYVAFAPAAIGWRGNPELQERLLRAVAAARAPIFLLQAENDYCLGPSEVLGAELERKGRPNRSRVYPPYGAGPREGHAAFACVGSDVWGDDVRAFLSAQLGSLAAA